MATLEQFGILCQVNDQAYRLIRNMRANAAEYIARANAGFDPVVLGQIMQADAGLFLVRIGTFSALAARNQTVLSNALAIIGVTLAQAAALRDTLVAACQHTQAATLTTAAQCVVEATLILSTVPAYEGLY